MEYLIIGLALLVIIVPSIAILPTARQRQQMAMRNAARAAGVSVQLVSIPDPNPDQDKYLTHTGRPIPPLLQVARYHVQRRRSEDRRVAPALDWALQKQADGAWRWREAPGAAMDAELAAWLELSVRSLPEDVAQVEEKDCDISVYWREREAGGERRVLDFLAACAAQPRRRPGAGENIA